MTPTMTRTYGFTAALRAMSKVADEVERGESVVITRRGSRFLLWKVEDAREALSRCYRFSPEVFFSESGVSIWLPELAVQGEGETLEKAQDDLIDAVIEYVEDWAEELRNYPDHADKAGWVHRLALTEGPGDLRETLFEQ